jgi:hypothetical protein
MPHLSFRRHHASYSRRLSVSLYAGLASSTRARAKRHLLHQTHVIETKDLPRSYFCRAYGYHCDIIHRGIVEPRRVATMVNTQISRSHPPPPRRQELPSSPCLLNFLSSDRDGSTIRIPRKLLKIHDLIISNRLGNNVSAASPSDFPTPHTPNPIPSLGIRNLPHMTPRRIIFHLYPCQ